MSYPAVEQVKVTECQLVEIWQRQLSGSSDLVTENGESMKIVYPGRTNDDQGADFRDAVIATSHGLVRGDIELHVKSSDWRVHQHHRNPVYNRVILHVVMRHDSKTETRLQNGKSIPVLALCKYVKTPISQWTGGEYLPVKLNVPCFKAAVCLPAGVILAFLDSSGDKRFLEKVSGFEADLAKVKASQSLYSGIMGALGYSRNKLPFIELARRLPLQVLESVTQSKMGDEECLARQQALLLGTAGLLPLTCADKHRENRGWMDKLEEIWASSPGSEAMSPDDWHLFKVRPSNFPVRRIVAMSYLLVRYRGEGVLKAVVDMIKEVPVDRAHLRLEEGLMVTATGYRASHFDFGLTGKVSNQTLLGRRRAADIVVNVLLPFALTRGKLSYQPGLEGKVFQLFHGYPRLVVNSIERHMRQQLGLGDRLVNSARRQQGLIHIYNTLCTQGKCHCCPLGELSPNKP